MQAVIYTDARNKLNKLINYVNDNSDQVIIVGSKGRKDAVLVSKEEFDNMVENLYVMSNPKWVKSIKKGISQLEKGKWKKLTIEQVLRVQK
ncbi:MAG: type II toxin-antitoxin system Phd/YefM family antitoxin [Ignavibacteriales bacterium]|jgi:antitoxin YefM|nr:type II toxin-antitoxin system Phd/YefM family antitoxin [Ignavibacteriales bacterium]